MTRRVPARLRRPLLVLVAVLWSLAGAWAGPRLAGPATYSTAVGDVQLRYGVTTPAHRGVDVYVPLADWGLRAAVTDAPVRVRAEPRRLDRAGVVRTVTESRAVTVRRLRHDVDRALRAALIRQVLLALAGALGGGLIAALIWYAAGVRGRRRLSAAPGMAVGLVAVLGIGLGAWTGLTFDGARLDEPSYYASGVELERIVEQADALRASASKYSSRVDNALRSVTGLLNDTGQGSNALAPSTSERDTRRLVLASDIHNNLLTLPILERYADDAPTVLAGDFTVNGGAMEAPLAVRMAAVSGTVVAVSGNHDSPGIMSTLARNGVTVLDHTDGVRTIGGIKMAGFEDPLAFAKGTYPKGIRAGMSFGDIPDGAERKRAAVSERWAWWQALPQRPQVLILHQEALGRELAARIEAQDPDGPPLTILVGHTHRQRLDRYGPVTVVNSGSIGAGGLFGIGEQSVGLALLDLDRATNALVATTLVSQNPSTDAARARRVITSSPGCDDALVHCHDEDEAQEEASATPTVAGDDQGGETASPTPTPGP
jgi:predicted phosphodiesterase